MDSTLSWIIIELSWPTFYNKCQFILCVFFNFWATKPWSTVFEPYPFPAFCCIIYLESFQLDAFFGFFYPLFLLNLEQDTFIDVTVKLLVIQPGEPALNPGFKISIRFCSGSNQGS